VSERLLTRPDWRTGLGIFGSRALSLVAALILAICISLGSFMLLALPAIAGYYYAVRHSKAERYFIDFPTIVRTAGLVVAGMAKCFGGSYVVGLTLLVPAWALLLAPVLTWSLLSDESMYAGLPLMVLWLPSFFLMGVALFNAYPYLVATNDSIGAVRYAVTTARREPGAAFVRGCIILFPVPGLIIHFLMALSYPIIAAWAVSETDEERAAFGEPGR
jgi:hypothetical protein